MSLADSAVEATAAEELWVNNHPVAGPESVASALDNFPEHLVAHDSRILDGDRT
jgi:hypothetical protein